MSKYDFSAVDVIDVAEPVLEDLQRKMRETTCGLERHVWRAMHDALEAAYLASHHATAMILAAAISAVVEGRQGEAVEAIAGKLKTQAATTRYSPSPN